MQEDGRLGARRPGPLPIDAVAVAHIEMSGGEGFDGGIERAHGPRCRKSGGQCNRQANRSEEHTSELQSLMRISYAVFCLKKKKHTYNRPATASDTQHN